MEFLSQLLERILTSFVLSVCIFVATFSYLTGRFPPRKSDMVRAFTLVREIISSQDELNAKTKDLQMYAGKMSLEQLAEFQRLSLRRTEIGLEMLKIFEKIKFTSADPAMEDKLQRITTHLTAAEKDLGEITMHLQSMSSPQQ